MRSIVIGVALLAAGPVSAQPTGEALFGERCAACHAISSGAAVAVGPNLSGVVGRKAGATTYAYSPALKRSTLVWTPDALDAYLAGPSKFVPGTRMPVAVADAKQRAAIIAYLQGLPQGLKR